MILFDECRFIRVLLGFWNHILPPNLWEPMKSFQQKSLRLSFLPNSVSEKKSLSHSSKITEHVYFVMLLTAMWHYLFLFEKYVVENKIIRITVK